MAEITVTIITATTVSDYIERLIIKNTVLDTFAALGPIPLKALKHSI